MLSSKDTVVRSIDIVFGVGPLDYIQFLNRKN